MRVDRMHVFGHENRSFWKHQQLQRRSVQYHYERYEYEPKHVSHTAIAKHIQAEGEQAEYMISNPA